ncbi:MAG: glycosyltransferase family 2 protein [Rickettsiales bacterium]|jgi:GT2 family glycosyltransferase/nucleoside-diphosphate-sugar epimerase|nr:glycosyltransferase family 2 protein [Rickettsiales bacterium]
MSLSLVNNAASTDKANTEQALVSVIMVSYQTGPILWQALESVLSQSFLKELVIVDNGNPYDITERLWSLSRQDARVKLLTGHGNIGFAAACNKGVEKASGDYILLLNPDCLISPGALKRVVEALQASPDYWVAGGSITNVDGTEQAGSRRNILTASVALVESFKLYRFLPNAWLPRMNFHHRPAPDRPIQVPAISGAFMMMPREIYSRVGKMDEGYFLHVEDLDFCLSIQKAGGKILHVPDVKVIHYRSTSDVSNTFIEKHKAEGFIRYFRKHFADAYFPGFIPLMSVAIYARYAVRVASDRLAQLNVRRFIAKRARKDRPSEEVLRQQFLSSWPQFVNQSPTFNGDNHALIRDNGPVLLGGGTGQVGLAILRRLLASDTETIGLYHSKVIDFSHEKLKWIYGNLQYPDGVDLRRHQPKTLIYTPALWYLPDHLEKFAAAGVKRLICFSSTSIQGKANSHNDYERDLVLKFQEAEEKVSRMADRLGIAWTIFRPTLIYGIGFDRNISSIVKFIKTFNFFPVYQEAKGLRQPVHADDLAKAVISVLNNPATFGKCYTLCGAEQLTYYEMVGRLFDALNMPRHIGSLQLLPHMIDAYSLLMRAPETNSEIARRMNHDLVFDDTAARQDFGYRPRPFLSAGVQDIFPDFYPTQGKKSDNNFSAFIKTA